MRMILSSALLLASWQGFAADGGFVLSVTNPKGGPESISLYADGAETTSKNQIKVPAVKTTVETSFFIHQLPAGVYWLKGYLPAATGVPLLDQSRWEMPVAALDRQRNRIEIKAGETLDLGRMQIDSLGGTLAVAIPDTSVPANVTLARPEMAGISQPVVTPAIPALSANEADVLSRSKKRASVVKSIVELDNGNWIALTSSGKLLTSSNGGDWSASRLISGERVVDYSVEAKLLITEFGRIWSLQDPASPKLLGGSPTGTVPYALACNEALSCVVAVKRGLAGTEQSMELYVFDKPGAEWKPVLSLPWKLFVWSGQMPAMQLVQKGSQVAVLHGKNQLTQIDLTTLAHTTATLPFNVFQPVVTAGRINIGERFSDDLGKTWQESSKRMRDGIVQVSSDGKAYASSVDLGFSVAKPIIRRSPDGKSAWQTLGPLPAAGELRVGRFSRQMYLVAGGYSGTNASLWKSVDGGISWAPDQSFNQAVSQ